MHKTVCMHNYTSTSDMVLSFYCFATTTHCLLCLRLVSTLTPKSLVI